MKQSRQKDNLRHNKMRVLFRGGATVDIYGVSGPLASLEISEHLVTFEYWYFFWRKTILLKKERILRIQTVGGFPSCLFPNGLRFDYQTENATDWFIFWTYQRRSVMEALNAKDYCVG